MKTKPKEKLTVHFGFRMTKGLRARIKREASIEGVYDSSLVTEAIERFLDRLEESRPIMKPEEE